MDISDYRASLKTECEPLPNGDWKLLVTGLKSKFTGDDRSQYVYLRLRDMGHCVSLIYYSPVMLDLRETSGEAKQINSLPDLLEVIGNEEKGFGGTGAGLSLMKVSGKLLYCLVLKDILRVQMPGSEEVTTIISPESMLATAKQYASAFDYLENFLEVAEVNSQIDML